LLDIAIYFKSWVCGDVDLLFHRPTIVVSTAQHGSNHHRIQPVAIRLNLLTEKKKSSLSCCVRAV
jgi:hypothetical protein